MMSYRYQRRGLGGFSVNDMIQNCGGSGSGGCDPRDSGCVATAQALSDWAQNNFEANFPFGPDTMPACPDLSDTTAITQAFMSNNPVSLGPQTGPGTAVPIPAELGTGGNVLAQYMTSGPIATGATNPANNAAGTVTINGVTYNKFADGTCQPNNNLSTPRVPCSSLQPAPATTPQGQTIVNSSGAGGTAAADVVPVTSGAPVAVSDWFTSSMFDGIPNWGLLAAAGVALLLVFGGKR